MLTTCPHCQAWFRVRAEHLTAANGVVTCGRCERVFSALASLVDEGTFAAVEPVARRDAAAPSPGPVAPAPGPAAPASELRADQAETAPLAPGADDEPAELAGDDATAAIALEDDAPLPPPGAIPGAEEDPPLGFDEATADAPDSTRVAAVDTPVTFVPVEPAASPEPGITHPGPDVMPAASPEPAAEDTGGAHAEPFDEHADAVAVAAAVEPVGTSAVDTEILETVITRAPPPASATPFEPAAEDTGEAPAERDDERTDAPAAAISPDTQAVPGADSEILESVITQGPPGPAAPAAAQDEAQDEAPSGSADDAFSPGATAFTRAYAAFEETDTHGEDLEFVFADDDDLDATLHMARPDLRVEPPPVLASAADDAPVGPTFDLADPAPGEAPPLADPGAFADDDLDVTLHMGRPDLRVEPPVAPASAADDAPVGPTFDLADPEPEDTVRPTGAAPDRSAAVAGGPATDASAGMDIASDAALDFGGLDALPRPAEPVDDVLPVRLPEDDAVLASLLDDPALSPAARAALASTLAAEAAAEGDAVADEDADAARAAASAMQPATGADPAAAESPASPATATEAAPLGVQPLEVAAAQASADDGEVSAAPPAGAIVDLPATVSDEPHGDDATPDTGIETQRDPDVPAALYDDLRALETPRRPRRTGWTVFALVLLVLGLAQGAFVARERLLTWLPAAAPAIDFLCARLPCAERRVEGAVRLLARDVREHPQYRDALLVNATIVNDGAAPAPYPVIDLRLRDAAGNVLAARQFQPDEYLDQSIDQAQGMPAGRPIYVVLELAGDASAAVSFEFTFL